MGKLIDITSRLKHENNTKKREPGSSAQVMNMVEARQEILSSERRELKRTILTEFVGAFIVVPGRGLLRVSLYDISDNGLSFEIDAAEGSFEEDERIAMRLYLNHKTFFEFIVEAKWSEDNSEQGFNRQGAQFVKNTVNDEALKHFVKFIEAVSVNLKADAGDLLVSRGS